nr:Chain P, PROTEIN (TGN38 PEPTIDE) [synthetic construct]2XA7_P Chain P, TGN38 CARGO PEPTIDE [Homo sapiens]6QH6_P Chain P, TGN38 CARGO PEPTIDE [Homo sapiens]6QH7_P Chain P, TGN38 CARGO PEPTIDE [Homo sapiens]7OG1_PPP Chain PPP, TGN38 CARGO PEPTIDE [Homo sapiens]
DYQRLN